MHIVIRRYDGKAEVIRELLQAKGDNLRQTMAGIPGFRGYYFVASGDSMATVTLCDDEAGTQESLRRAAEWVKAHVPAAAALSAPQITAGDVLLAATP